MDQAVLAVVRRFPHLKDEVESLTKRNDAFQEACEDFFDATKALDWWAATPNGAASVNRKAEYQALVEDLAREILMMLETQDSDPIV